jgi:hypothetical protein
MGDDVHEGVSGDRRFVVAMVYGTNLHDRANGDSSPFFSEQGHMSSRRINRYDTLTNVKCDCLN